MSFSSDVKKELAVVKPEKSCCGLSELCGLYATMGSLSLLGRGKVNVQLTSESLAVCRRAYTLIAQTLHVSPQIHYVTNARFGGTRKCVLTLGPIQSPLFLEKMQMISLDDEGQPVFRSATPRISLSRGCCNRAFLRGAFLGGGYITNPEQNYHLELGYRDENVRDYLARALQRCDLPIRQSSRKNQDFLYIKQSEQIIAFLTLVGAHQSVMHMENLRIQRDIYSTVTRAINCDAANMKKQLHAAEEQTQAIMRLARKDGLKGLPPSLQQIAVARLNAPDLNLAQLGQTMDPPLSKSAVNHRMRRLMELAGEELTTEQSDPASPGDKNEV
jgi:DNA-binding protein WhiA